MCDASTSPPESTRAGSNRQPSARADDPQISLVYRASRRKVTEDHCGRTSSSSVAEVLHGVAQNSDYRPCSHPTTRRTHSRELPRDVAPPRTIATKDLPPTPPRSAASSPESARSTGSQKPWTQTGTPTPRRNFSSTTSAARPTLSTTSSPCSPQSLEDDFYMRPRRSRDARVPAYERSYTPPPEVPQPVNTLPGTMSTSQQQPQGRRPNAAGRAPMHHRARSQQIPKRRSIEGLRAQIKTSVRNMFSRSRTDPATVERIEDHHWTDE